MWLLGPGWKSGSCQRTLVGHRKVLNEGYEPPGAGTGQGRESATVMCDSIISAALYIQNLGAVPSDCVAWRKFFKKV